MLSASYLSGANVNATDGEGRIGWKEAKGPKIMRILKDAGAERK